MSDEIQGRGEGEIGGVTGEASALPPWWQWDQEHGAILVGTGGKILASVLDRGYDKGRRILRLRVPTPGDVGVSTVLDWLVAPELLYCGQVSSQTDDDGETVHRVRDYVVSKPEGVDAIGETFDVSIPDDWMTRRDTVEWLARVVDRGLRRMGVIGDPGLAEPDSGPGNDAPEPYYWVGVRLGELLAGATDSDAEAAARVLEEWAGAVLEWAKRPDLYDAIEELRPAIDAMLEPEGPVRLPVDSIRRAIATLQWRIGRLEAFEAAALAHVDELAAALVYLPRGSREWEALGTALDRFAESIPDRFGQDDAARYWETREEIAAAPTQGRMSAPDADALRVLLEHLNAGDHTPEAVRCAVTRLVDVAVSDPVPPGWEDPYSVEAERLATRILAMVNRSAERE